MERLCQVQSAHGRPPLLPRHELLDDGVQVDEDGLVTHIAGEGGIVSVVPLPELAGDINWSAGTEYVYQPTMSLSQLLLRVQCTDKITNYVTATPNKLN